MKPLSFDEVINNLRIALGVSRDAEVARSLKISPQTLVGRRKTGSILYKEIINSAIENAFDLNEIFIGNGEPDNLKEAVQGDLIDSELIHKIAQDIKEEQDILEHVDEDAIAAVIKSRLERKIKFNGNLLFKYNTSEPGNYVGDGLYEEKTISNNRPGGYLENTNMDRLVDDFVLVPRYDVTASAGHGTMIHSEQIVDHLAFKREWVRKDLGLNPEKLALINSVGDSMEPAILNNDLLLVDLENNTLSDDTIYVISVNGSLLVKRIQQMLNGSVVIKSDNPIYKEQTLKKEELSDLRVLGRVVWFGRYM